MNKRIHIGMIGTQFMGKAHSNAYLQAPRFFDLPLQPVLHTACGRNAQQLALFGKRFGWNKWCTSWKEMVADETIALVDICAPNNMHAPVAIAAAQAGKHVLCEKPLARNEEEAWEMYEAAQKAGIVNMVVFNYRFLPAVALAKQLIEAGKLGTIRHFNAVYYQDWLVDPGFPFVWRHDADVSGSGAHGDMNAHIVDLARYLVGEIAEVNGVQKTFITERPFADRSGTGKVTADDATSFLATFETGALGSFLATRLAPGKKNFLRFEIFGSEGSVVFNLERLNELQYFSGDSDASSQGYRTLHVTESAHPYMDAWWPPGHNIGWEHSFIHVVKALLETIAGEQPAIPDFYDGFRCQQVLDAVVASAASGSWIRIHQPQSAKTNRNAIV
jgi:predicted dehydrogenase